jgi:protoporphyrinogen/coproporphyrinogen III oxidase
MDTRQEYPRQTEYYTLYKIEDTVYKTEMPHTPAVDEEAPVIVVGAGPSGLAAAWRLTRHGRPVLVLEARNRIGGQVNTRREAGYLMEEGATILPSRYEPVMRLVREAGIVDQLIPAGSVIGFARDGKIHDFRSQALAADALKSTLVSAKSKLAMVQLGIDNVRSRKTLSYEDLSAASALDTMTPKEYCQHHWGMAGEVYEYVIDSTVRGVLGTRGDKISLAELFFMLNNILGSKLWAIKDGYSAYTTALARGLDIRLGATVTEIAEDRGGVRVEWTGPDGSHTSYGAAAIVTTRANVIPDIVRSLPDADCEFLRSVRYTKVVTANLGLTKAPPGIAASVVQVPRLEDEGLMAFTLEHNKAPGRAPEGKGLVCLLTMAEWAETLIDEDDETVLRKVTNAAEKLMPGFSDDIDYVNINRWDPCIVYSRPGLYRELGRFVARRPPDTPIKIAGSFFSSSNMCTATAAGERAAREVLAGALIRR